MNRLQRFSVAAMVAALLPGAGIGASAAGAGFIATVTPACVLAGGAITVNIPELPAGSTVAVRLSYSTANGGGTVYASGTANSQGIFNTTLALPTTATPGNASLAILTAALSVDQFGAGTITVGTAAGCPSPGPATITGQGEIAASTTTVKKSCASGLSGNAVFGVMVGFGEGGSFQFPDITVACNGTATLPPLAAGGVTVTLHEASPPPGAVAAADTTVTLSAATNPITIQNNEAASTATPAPSARVLPLTGSPSHSDPTPLALLAILAGAAMVVAAAVSLRKRES